MLILDDPFAKVDHETRNNLLEVMKRIKDVQIILTTGIHKEVERKE